MTLSKRQRLKIRCYCCSEVIKDEMALCANTGGLQYRLFPMLPSHAKNIDGVYEIVIRGKRK